MSEQVFTVGHSNYEIEDFLAILKRHEITAIGDVRSVPYSKYAPQFSEENLKNSLLEAGISYVFLGHELGARPANKALYLEDGQVDWDKVADTKIFSDGIDRVMVGACKYRLALMCSEKDPLGCHRTHLVARHLVVRGADVFHILKAGNETHIKSHEEIIGATKAGREPDLFRSPDEVVYEAAQSKLAYKRAGAG